MTPRKKRIGKHGLAKGEFDRLMKYYRDRGYVSKGEEGYTRVEIPAGHPDNEKFEKLLEFMEMEVWGDA